MQSRWTMLRIGMLLLVLGCHKPQEESTMPHPREETGLLIVLRASDRAALNQALAADGGLTTQRERGLVTFGEALDDADTVVVYVPGDESVPAVLRSGGSAWEVSEVRSLRHRALPATGVNAPYAAVVRQRVESFDRWWEAFEDLKDARDRAGIVGVRVSQSVDDPQVVHLYALFSDPERYAALFRSAELRERLAAGGVIGTPEVLKVRHFSP